MRAPLLTGLVLGLVTLAPAAFASYPAGVWSLPTEVTVTGSETDTPSVLITGVFTVHTGDGAVGNWGFSGFEPAAAGYMHFVCATGDKAMCLLQWQDIANAARDKGCVGWSETGLDSGEVHPAGVALGTPDPWHLAIGVVTGFTPCEYLKSYVPPEVELADPSVEHAEPPPSEIVDSTGATLPIEAIEVSPADSSAPDVAAAEAAAETAAPMPATKDSGCSGGAMSLLALLGLGLARCSPRFARLLRRR